jgi:Tfp pilus assembly protein PilV
MTVFRYDRRLVALAVIAISALGLVLLCVASSSYAQSSAGDISSKQVVGREITPLTTGEAENAPGGEERESND